MTKVQRNFIKGRMNKSVDERLVPNGEYIDALNVRLGSTEQSEIGSVENSKGNTVLTALKFLNIDLSANAKCIGAFEDGAKETIYWFVHDPSAPAAISPTGKCDMIVSFETTQSVLEYHIISVYDGGVNQADTVLNFDPSFLITGVTKVEDLLFFTDNLNPPRFINVKRSYLDPTTNNTVLLTDGDGNPELLAETILVVKKPPIEAPSIELTRLAGQENFLEERLICFAYRYEYENDSYSATSQFTEVAFSTGAFGYAANTALNEGMINIFNTAIITFNSGGPLVKGIDLLFKENDNPTIKVIEKLNKEDLGYADDTEYTYTFQNSKIFTILPESETLRLYDNVPLKAQALTLMGNRLIYGNYEDNYDLIDEFNSPVRFDYFARLNAELIGFSEIPDSFDVGTYTYGSTQTISDSMLKIDLAGVDLVQGASITIDARFTHSLFSGTPAPSETTVNVQVELSFILINSYASVYDLATSVEFQEAVGIATNIKPVYDADPNAETSCDGNTWTDIVNCAIPQTLDANQTPSFTKVESGINGSNEPLFIETTPGSTEIGIQLIAMKFVDDPTLIGDIVYEYYEWTFAEVTFQEVANARSLHSNRDYEVGIIYMDEYNRATTALVSENNSVHIPCANSETKNNLIVTIPVTQRPPKWAKRYKFCIKPDRETYETIYSNIFFTDPATNDTYFLLEGENQNKVNDGDRYIVKADTDGPLNRCAFATVLEKEAQTEDFIEVPTGAQDSNGDDILVPIPAGTYMKMRVNTFSIDTGENPVITPGQQQTSALNGNYPIEKYQGLSGEPDANGVYTPFDIPQGSRIVLKIKWNRDGVGQGNGNCERRRYNLELTLVSNNDYDNIIDWWNGQNIQALINTGEQEVGGGASLITNEYISTLATEADGNPGATISPTLSTNFIQWYQHTVTNEIIFLVSGTRGCGGLSRKSKRRSRVKVEWEIFRAESTIVWETLPLDANPDIWFEGSQSFAIENGLHQSGNQSGDQNQTALLPALVSTDFANCFAFGNGVESYKIRDSIIGKTMVLGNRVTSTQSEDYRKVHRFADLTYSGIYNDESNVNKLNEFNLGLLNFKNLEDSFGPIMRIEGRSTDVLCLQEDKISYVLAGKNLLSDAAVGGAIASVPEVLGTQIARLEEFGISRNPESYAIYGYDKYFSDAKRGALLQLKGTAYSNEQLIVISENNMRSWFRDLFIDFPTTQKLGGFDPYMDEYVFSSNNLQLPSEVVCIDCNTTRTFPKDANQIIDLCYDLGSLVGDVGIVINVTNITNDIELDFNYNNASTTVDIDVDGTYTETINKDSVQESQLDVTVSGVGSATIELTVNCPDAPTIRIYQITVNNNNEANQSIHNEYRWTDGAFISPQHSELVVLQAGSDNPLVSQYSVVSGPQGGGVIPANGATVTINNNKIPPSDDFVFNPNTMSFKFLRSNIGYNNTPADILALLLNASTQTLPTDATLAPDIYSGQFTMPNTGDNLYLIYDYRQPTEVILCYGTSVADVCCECDQSDPPSAVTFLVQQCRNDQVINIEYVDQTDLSGTISIGDFITINDPSLTPGCAFEVLSQSNQTATFSALAKLNIENCSGTCQEYTVTNPTSIKPTVFYTDCQGAPQQVLIDVGASVTFCSSGSITSSGVFIDDLVVVLNKCECGAPPPTTNYRLRRCQSTFTNSAPPEVIADSPLITPSIGNLVVITGQPDCVYEVISLVQDLASISITSFATESTCTQVCNFYTVNLASGTSGSITFKDCDNGGQVTTINFSQKTTSATICTTEVTQISNNVDLIFNNCKCPEEEEPAFLGKLCAGQGLDSTQFQDIFDVLEDSFGLGVQVGDFVEVDSKFTGSSCVYEIVSTTSSAPVYPIDRLHPQQSCVGVDNIYELTNSTVNQKSVEYVDCTFATQLISIPPGFTDVIGATEFVSVDSGVVVNVISCDCVTPI